MSPLHDFRCEKCGKEFEALVRPLEFPSCECGSADVVRSVCATKSYRIHGDNSASETPKRLQMKES